MFITDLLRNQLINWKYYKGQVTSNSAYDKQGLAISVGVLNPKKFLTIFRREQKKLSQLEIWELKLQKLTGNTTPVEKVQMLYNADVNHGIKKF